MSNFFFWGIMTDNDAQEMWQVLHEHFERLAREDSLKLASENDDGVSEVISTEGKAAPRK